MVTAATLQAMGIKGTESATVKDVVDAVTQSEAVVGVGIAVSSIGPRIVQVITTNHTIDVRCCDIVHVAAHDDISGRFNEGFTQGCRILTT